MNKALAKDIDHPARFVATDFAAWSRAWAGLGVAFASRNVFDELLSSYGEAHRAYHTRQHLEDCLVSLDEVREQCDHADEVAMALWFHDAIYKPRRSDNEAASADWLTRVARDSGVVESSVTRMHALIMATRHTAAIDEHDAKVLVDIDLSILGAPAERFDAYEMQVRQEYRWVPGPIYRAKRADILQGFMDRRTIYETPHFRARLEEAARENMLRSISLLRR
ncbi:N-methyl-D-aspartate receptor NMDAR2C subunit [Dyella sp. GSA-30]|uniref:HD domain-containing protein n=1 Tax=Dyella sp. GSA-30 TaxID=2994496 RepID=UPI002491E4B0|nr:N-methyl-D-aspartate receptor NMDAR2C subunit [Dyella sp. GSA-30]BDU19380.1 metal-dependent hydrolase [Dyella sp. GSA-30]